MTLLNKLLEIVNGNLAILRFEFLIFLAVYLYMAADEMKPRDWFVALPLGMAVAVSMFFNNAGELGRNVVVWTWRVSTGGVVPLTDFQLGMLTAFASVAALGLLLMIRIFSRPFFGNFPWVFCAITVIGYTLYAVQK